MDAIPHSALGTRLSTRIRLHWLEWVEWNGFETASVKLRDMALKSFCAVLMPQASMPCHRQIIYASVHS